MSTIALIDGAQIFGATKHMDRNSSLDYVAFKRMIDDIAEEPAQQIFFQPYNETLEGHRKIIHFLSKVAGFQVITEKCSELSPRISDYIFSVQIAYQMAKAKYKNDYQKIIVVSPDNKLVEPILDCDAQLVYFRSYLGEELQENAKSGQINFYDLEPLKTSLLLQKEEHVD